MSAPAGCCPEIVRSDLTLRFGQTSVWQDLVPVNVSCGSTVLEIATRFIEQRLNALIDLFNQWRGGISSGPCDLRLDLVIESRHAQHQKLVKLRADKREELHPFQQGGAD